MSPNTLKSSGTSVVAPSDGSHYDAIVIGSGFGGCMAALPMVEAGMRVLMLERGDWVKRGEENWGDKGPFVLTPHYTTESDYSLRTRLGWRSQGISACVGGPSVFYGGASFRFRADDFTPPPDVVGPEGTSWPISYDDLEPFYTRAEWLMSIAGEAGIDPTDPPRSLPYPRPAPPLAPPSRRIAEAARGLGLRPFPIPLAIDHDSCVSCTTCDAFACAVDAKNDLATQLVPRLLASGMELRANSVAVRIEADGRRVRSVHAVDVVTGERLVMTADRFILAAGALASPHLLLASGLDQRNPGGATVGRFLMRHCNAMMYGYFREAPNPDGSHHKQLAIHDFYFGDKRVPSLGKLGNIQQVMAPPISLIRAMLPKVAHRVVSAVVGHLTGLLVVAEDQPRSTNRVAVDSTRRDRFGLPAARIFHRYSSRDLAARRALLYRARQILRRSGARFTLTWPVNTFSHAVGTVRMGSDPSASALDPNCRFRGMDNLWLTDGSVFPASAGVNPSLTIAANALRVGHAIAAGTG